MRAFLRHFVDEARAMWHSHPEEVVRFLVVFAIVAMTAKLGQLVFFEWKTSPAVLWPPTGIALAVIWMWGYRYWIPVFGALVLVTLTGPKAHLVPAIVTTPAAQVLGGVIGAYILKRFSFDATFSRMQDVLVFFGAILLTCMISPTISTAVAFLTGNLTTPVYISWSRSWAGYVFSCLILTPFILSWVHGSRLRASRGFIETLTVSVLLLLSVYGLFWHSVASSFSFLLFATFFFAHLWICFRFETKAVTLAVFTTTLFGILGLFLAPNPERQLNDQLFATELFLFLIVPIFFAFSTLVKDRAKTIAELQAAVGRIAEENAIKNNFIAVLAHELRNPLAPVKTTLEILEMQESDAETKRLIDGASQQIYAMRRLLDDLLDITRVTQGKFQLQIEHAQLCAMIERSVASTKALFDRKHTVVIDPECDNSIWINVDPVRFEQVMVNLTNNAAKYTDPGGRITVGWKKHGSMLELKVTDNGAGIAPENLANIFTPFWQARNSPTASGGGIGIGLSLTKHIIELHGGTIRAESQGRGKGSTFTVRMPLPAPEERVSMAAPLQARLMPSFKILVVDDNEAAASSLAKLLTLRGHEARPVYTGTGALEEVGVFLPDVVLLDIGLPDMTGYEVVERLRANGFSNPTVALSGYGQKEDMDKAFAAGFDHHFIKPLAVARLEEYLSTLP